MVTLVVVDISEQSSSQGDVDCDRQLLKGNRPLVVRRKNFDTSLFIPRRQLCVRRRLFPCIFGEILSRCDILIMAGSPSLAYSGSVPGLGTSFSLFESNKRSKNPFGLLSKVSPKTLLAAACLSSFVKIPREFCFGKFVSLPEVSMGLNQPEP